MIWEEFHNKFKSKVNHYKILNVEGTKNNS